MIGRLRFVPGPKTSAKPKHMTPTGHALQQLMQQLPGRMDDRSLIGDAGTLCNERLQATPRIRSQPGIGHAVQQGGHAWTWHPAVRGDEADHRKGVRVPRNDRFRGSNIRPGCVS